MWTNSSYYRIRYVCLYVEKNIYFVPMSKNRALLILRNPLQIKSLKFIQFENEFLMRFHINRETAFYSVFFIHEIHFEWLIHQPKISYLKELMGYWSEPICIRTLNTISYPCVRMCIVSFLVSKVRHASLRTNKYHDIPLRSF